MKRKLLTLTAVLLCCAAMICGIVFAASAEDDYPEVTIKGHSLALQNNIKIVYYVKEDNIPAGAETGILFWINDAPEYIENEDFRVTEKQEPETIGGVTYQKYYFEGLDAKQMTDTVYAVPFFKVGNTEVYGDMDKYSVIEYACNKKSDTDLADLLAATLDYGAAAQKYFDYHTERLANAEFVHVTVSGGMLTDGMTKGLFAVGSTVTLIPDYAPDGYAFDCWSINGVDVTENQFIVTADTTVTAKWKEAFTYALSSDETSYILTGVAEGVTLKDFENIPSEYNGKPVTEIGSYAFYRNKTIESIDLPNTVTKIGQGAFKESTVFNVGLPKSDLTIGTDAFASTENLEIVMFSSKKSVTIGSKAFYNSGVGIVHFPEVTFSIGESAFQNCKSLSIVMFPEDAAFTIGAYAFESCPLTNGINLPDQPVVIGEKAFLNSGLTSLILPEKIASVGDSAFRSCALEDLIIDGASTTFGSYVFAQCSQLSYVRLCGGMTVIKDHMFYECGALQTITLPDTIKELEAYAFYKTGLTEITLPASTATVGNDAFGCCASLVKADVSSATTLGKWLFDEGCYKLEEIVLGSKLTAIPGAMVEWCTGLETIRFGGTMLEWQNLLRSAGDNWSNQSGEFIVICSDGTLDKSGNTID